MTVTATGGLAIGEAISASVEQGIVRAEMISIPLTILIQAIVVGGLVTAGVPLLLAALAIVGAIAAVFALSTAGFQSIFAVNIITMRGLGLGIDYSLLMVARCREEIRRRPVEETVSVSMATVGKAIHFSGVTVIFGLAATQVFSLPARRSMRQAGMIVVALALVYRLTSLPALLAALGPRIDAVPIGRRRTAGRRDGGGILAPGGGAGDGAAGGGAGPRHDPVDGAVDCWAPAGPGVLWARVVERLGLGHAEHAPAGIVPSAADWARSASPCVVEAVPTGGPARSGPATCPRSPTSPTPGRPNASILRCFRANRLDVEPDGGRDVGKGFLVGGALADHDAFRRFGVDPDREFQPATGVPIRGHLARHPLARVGGRGRARFGTLSAMSDPRADPDAPAVPAVDPLAVPAAESEPGDDAAPAAAEAGVEAVPMRRSDPLATGAAVLLMAALLSCAALVLIAAGNA